ncbi:MAG: LAGLIDADG family homing endonuclease [Nanoarchaeota archaeon]|nr:LAGLIDADG family homing endonuclease [Nanoarchaeota archaeon]
MKIKFKSVEARKLFFDEVHKYYSKSWKEIYLILDYPKSTFERYKSGESCLSEKLFNKLLDLLSVDIKDLIIGKTESISDNFGQILGGKNAYKLNVEYFKRGREIGSKAIKKFRKIRQIVEVSFKDFNLSKDVCEFIGAFIGDGMFNVYRNNVYHVEFACDKRYDLDYYNQVIIPAISKVVPNIKVHFYKSYMRENAIRVVFYSRKLFFFLKDFCGFIPGRKAHTVKIPDFLLSDEIFRNRVIRGIFDTDGGVFIDRRKKYLTPYPRIFIQTVSKPLYEQLYLILSKKFSLYTRFNPKRQIYIIEIYGINQVKHWMSLIGFSNKRHLHKVASVAQR